MASHKMVVLVDVCPVYSGWLVSLFSKDLQGSGWKALGEAWEARKVDWYRRTHERGTQAYVIPQKG